MIEISQTFSGFRVRVSGPGLQVFLYKIFVAAATKSKLLFAHMKSLQVSMYTGWTGFYFAFNSFCILGAVWKPGNSFSDDLLEY